VAISIVGALAEEAQRSDPAPCHRLAQDTMELTMRIVDPKMYSEPWLAMNRFPLHLMPPDFDIRENLWSPTLYKEYNDLYGTPAIREPAT
jgi:hypothetical protein